VPKFSAQAIRKAYDIDWQPAGIRGQRRFRRLRGAIRPAGVRSSKKASFPPPIKRTRPTRSGEAIRQCRPGNVWMDKYNPRVDRSDYYASLRLQCRFFAVVQLLRQCGDNLTRENIMKQASHLDMELPLLLPGIRLKTSFDGPCARSNKCGWCVFDGRALRAVQ